MSNERKVQNLLVTGGAGFIGSAFIRYVLQNVSEFEGVCVNLDKLTYAGNLRNLEAVKDDPRYVFHHGDVCNGAFVEHLCREYEIDTIVHFAAESHVDRSICGPQPFIETNIIGTFSLLEIVRKIPEMHFHHVSTDEVYGSLGPTGAFHERSSYAPSSPYSASKASADHLVRAYANTYNLSTCLSNCSNNYGPYQFPEKLIPLMILNCLDRKPLPIYGDGKNVRDWLYVEDHVEALWLLLNKGKRGQTYNIGGEAEHSNLDVVQAICHTVARLQEIEPQELLSLITFVADRPGHDRRYAMDIFKMRTQLDWEPRHSFQEGLEKTIRWYLEHQDWVDAVRDGSYKEWMQRHYQGVER